MTRLSGIRVLALSFALWALAAWLFGSPDPAAPETAAKAARETTSEPGAGVAEGVRADAAAVHVQPDPANRDSAPSQDHAADPASASSRTGATRAAEGMAAPAAPAAGSQIARAPAAPPAVPDGEPAAAIPTVPSQAPETAAAGAPTTSPTAPAPSVGSRQGDAAGIGASPSDAGTPLASIRPAPRLDPSMPRAPRPPGTPSRPGGAAADRGAVAAQVDAARRAAWEGRLADALVHYRAAARAQPESYAVWGEMGNVLWAMGRWPEAAYALEGAATLLVGAGELRAANALLPAVRNIDPDAAHRIQQRLWAASQRPPG